MAQGVSEAGQPQPEPGLAPGTVVADRYRIERLLGEGGMGAVYRAEHVHMRKAVALKVLHPDASEFPEVVARFEREAIAAAHIAHPNVVSATDFGKLPDGSFFLVLEFVDGDSLRDVIARGPVTAERALHVIREIASALAVAHKSGVVHRDLKPENIMLVARPDGPEAVKVFDFGIAKIDVSSVTGKQASTLQPITRVGTIFGTPDYMAPEQAMGQPVDGRADLYALGVILFEMLTGTRPFKGGAVTLMRQHILQDVPQLPANVASTVDTRLEPILAKLLAKDPAARYANASELVEALDAMSGRGGEQRSAPPPATKSAPAPRVPTPVVDDVDDQAKTVRTPHDKSWRPVARAAYSAEESTKRKRRLAIGGALLLVCVGAAGAVALSSGTQKSPQSGARAVSVKAKGTPGPAESAAPEADPSASATNEPSAAASGSGDPTTNTEPTAAATPEPEASAAPAPVAPPPRAAPVERRDPTPAPKSGSKTKSTKRKGKDSR